MTVFIATLFSPYTINFGGCSPSTVSRSSETPNVEAPDPISTPKTCFDVVGSSTYRHERSQSLTHAPTYLQPFATRGSAIPQTPGATTDTEQIFLPHDPKRPFSLTLPPKKHIGNRSTASLQTLAAIDSQAAGWGLTVDFKQPKSRAKSPPAASILSRDNACPADYEANVQTSKYARFVSSTPPAPDNEHEFLDETYTFEPSIIGNPGLFSAINAVTESGQLPDKTWVGTLGMPTDALTQSLKDDIASKLENEYETLCVFVNDSDMNGHYEHYCKTVLWPIFHYQIPDHPKSKAFQDRSWIYYLKVNEAFADRIISNYKKGDVVWVHDYHLMLVPGLVRARLPEVQIGFFLHSAFPSSEVFRVLPVRKQLIEGILGANMIGFQCQEYVHHFLQTCSRIMNVEATDHGLMLENGRRVDVSTFPVGIDVFSMDQRRDLEEVKEWIKVVGEKYSGKKIILARDKFDNVHGIREKMLAYELFLDTFPEWTDKVVLIQIAAATTQDTYLSNAVHDVITRINSAYSTLAHQPVVLLRQDIDYSQYLALLTVAECLIITGLRQGMNLTGHEFVICQDGKHSLKQHAPVILSEFTGAASVLGRGALLINPWDYRAVAEAIYQALTMNATDREQRWKMMYAQINKRDATAWYVSYVSSLQRSWAEDMIRESSAVPRLSLNEIRHKYTKANRRLLLIDYEGTLLPAPLLHKASLTAPKHAVDVLNELTDSEKNTVYIMSQRTPAELETTFEQVPDLGLIAENGSFLRLARTREWIEVVDMKHVQCWKGGVKAIMKYYEERIDGSEIEELQSAFLFRYALADDQEYAFRQAGECANQINEVCRGEQVAAVPVEQGLYVSGSDVNKASAAKIVEASSNLHNSGQFVLVIGDSREDEYVFNWAHGLRERGFGSIFTVSVGQRNTEAMATLTQGTSAVLSTLEKLARVW